MNDSFSLADFDFVHGPGGHAPMVDFNDNPLVGELLHSLRDSGVPISLICHAPIAMTSAKYRVDADGKVTVNEDHEFTGAHITTVPKYGELPMLKVGYPKIPGERTRLPYYVEVALKEADSDVALTLNPSAAKTAWDADHNLLTGNGPQAVDEQADRLTDISVSAETPRWQPAYDPPSAGHVRPGGREQATSGRCVIHRPEAAVMWTHRPRAKTHAHAAVRPSVPPRADA